MQVIPIIERSITVSLCLIIANIIWREGLNGVLKNFV
jgi:hypothetical protein